MTYWCLRAFFRAVQKTRCWRYLRERQGVNEHVTLSKYTLPPEGESNELSFPSRKMVLCSRPFAFFICVVRARLVYLWKAGIIAQNR